MPREQNGNGNGTNSVADLTLRLLKKLRTEVLGLRTEMAEFRAEVDRRFAQVDRRLAQVDLRFAQVDRRFDAMDDRFHVLTRAIKNTHRMHGKRILTLEVQTGLRAR